MKTSLFTICISICAWGVAAGGDEASLSPRVPISLQVPSVALEPSNSLAAPVLFPADCDINLLTPDGGWPGAESLAFDVVVPPTAPSNVQVLVYLKDWEHFWFQTEASRMLSPGSTNHFEFDMTPESEAWLPHGHAGGWHYRTLMAPPLFGIRIFCPESFVGKVEVRDAVASMPTNQPPPTLRNVAPSASEVPQFSRFEITCDLPDRYRNPFDPDEVSLRAFFTAPDGEEIRVDGFYAQNFYRKVMLSDEFSLPQGKPFWQIRFAPRQRGQYRYRLEVEDRWGISSSHEGVLTAVAPVTPGTVRVSPRDPRYFEYENGEPFFLIGHNIRSPFDTRNQQQFPSRQRWPEGASSYSRRFADMGAHGENLAEVWTASWSLGLEWSDAWRGYHGVGQYNMMHAWELDRVIDAALEHDIKINLVIHNHGKFSAFSDQEWAHNPFNEAQGGYLKSPDAYLTDPRALRSFENLMRYMVARWGYSDHLFAWELWSEFDLTGGDRGKSMHKSDAAVAWHRRMGDFIKSIDPNQHMISTHVCGDYHHQYAPTISLPQIDLCPVDAYHGSSSPLHIVRLMRETAAFNKPFGKPVQITEFGGTSSGAAIKHLRESLHAAAWAACTTELPGTPMLWWWHVIEEEGFYSIYAAVDRFMEGVDKRDSSLVSYDTPVLVDGRPDAKMTLQALKSPTRCFGWLYHELPLYETRDPSGSALTKGVSVRLDDMRAGSYTVEFWDTQRGEVVLTRKQSPNDGIMVVDFPPFARDMAVKVSR
jgi:hypothetical protein